MANWNDLLLNNKNNIVTLMEVYVPSTLISLMPLRPNDIYTLEAFKEPNKEKKNNDDVTNKICVVETPTVDGETLPKHFYRVLGSIDEIAGININSLLVKEVFLDENNNFVYNNDDTRMHYSLTRDDCKFLNIDYQDGIELLPYYPVKFIDEPKSSLPTVDEQIKSIIDKVNNYDLSTYPTCVIDNTIRKIVIKLDNFRPLNDNCIILPNNAIIDLKRFVNSLKIELKLNIASYDDMTAGFIKGRLLNFNIVTPTMTKLNIADDKGEIFIEVLFTRESNITSDRKVGISPKALDGIGVNDLINVICDDGNMVTPTFDVDKLREYKKREAEIRRELDGIFNSKMKWKLHTVENHLIR